MSELLRLLDQAAEAEPDETKSSRLRALDAALRDLGTETAGHFLGALFSHIAGI